MRLNLYKRLLYQKLKRNKLYLIYIPLVVYWIILFTATTLPGGSAPKIAASDKLKHFGGYFVLAALLHLTLHFQRKIKKFYKKPLLWTLIITSVYGALDEIHQLFVPGRNAELLDWIADISGALLAVVVTGTIIKSGLLPDKPVRGTKL